ncbi:SRPBCC family protein [Crocinitomicaceae bacterium]|nr:SRPBCC family protein [Crocinitomicaceae bacterium]
MPKMHIERSGLINASLDEVFKIVSDFHTWTEWSPWLVTEPGAKVNVREDGKYYSWEGDVVGAGEMTISNEVENTSVDIDLMFLKPWKSKAKISFHMKKEGDGVRLSWDMNSSLPFFLFWMKKMMEAFVGNDYERGLTMLKDYSEQGKVPHTITVKGMDEFKGKKYIGIKRNFAVKGIPDAMREDYTKLMEYVMGGYADKQDGASFTIYHKWDMVSGEASYTACVPVTEVPTDLPTGVITGSVPATKVHVVHGKGPYRFTGNIWSAQYLRQRGKKFKANKGVDPMEVYLNSPMNTDENDLETEVLFAVKS